MQNFRFDIFILSDTQTKNSMSIKPLKNGSSLLYNLEKKSARCGFSLKVRISQNIVDL